MTALKIGVAVQSLRKPVRASLELSARTGAEGVELDLRNGLPAADLTPSAVRQLRKLMDDLRLTPASASFPTRRGYGDPDRLDHRIAATQAAIKAGSQVGAKTLVIRLGNVPEESGSSGMSLLVDSLTTLARYGDHFGVRIALLASGECQQRLRPLLDELPEYAVGACLDPAELLSSGHSPAEFAAELGGAVTHLYATDAVRDLSTRSAVPVELGRGSVDWPELLGKLEEFDYHEWAILFLREGSDPAELENAVAYLRAL